MRVHVARSAHNRDVPAENARPLLFGSMDLLLIGLMFGVWGSFMVYGWVLEDIKGTAWGEQGERFRDTDFLILCQSIGNSTVAAFLLLLFKDGPVLKRCDH